MQEGAHARDHHARPGGAGRPGGPLQDSRALRAEGEARHGGRQDEPAGAAGQRDGFGTVGEQFGPVGAVLGVPGGGAVGLLGGDQLVHVAEGAGRCVTPLRQRPVHLGEPLVEQGHAGAVDHDVMDAQVVQVPAGAEREQRVAAEAGPVERHRFRAVLLHPADRLGLRVLVPGEVEVPQQHRGVRHAVRALGLVRALRGERAVRAVRASLLVGEEAGAEGLRLGHGVPQGRAQYGVVQRAVDLQTGAGLVVRAARVQLLREPHLVLRTGQAVPNGRELRHLSPHNLPPEPPAFSCRAEK